jgi:hypothetical protein
MDLHLIWSEKDQKGNQPLVPYKAVVAPLHLSGEINAGTKVNRGAAVHTQDTTYLKVVPGLPQIVGIRKQCRMFLDVSLFREKPGTR